MPSRRRLGPAALARREGLVNSGQGMGALRVAHKGRAVRETLEGGVVRQAYVDQGEAWQVAVASRRRASRGRLSLLGFRIVAKAVGALGARRGKAPAMVRRALAASQDQPIRRVWNAADWRPGRFPSSAGSPTGTTLRSLTGCTRTPCLA